MRELAFERMIERGLVDSRSGRFISNEDMKCQNMGVVEILEQASMQIKGLYFDIPVAGSKAKFFRERAYCYELYHQIRLLRKDQADYLIHGELDKGGNPTFKHTILKQSKPDFLFHVPGAKSSNVAVIEVKHCKANVRGLQKDVTHLIEFIKHGYSQAILLIFGSDLTNVESKLKKICFEEKVDLSKIIFLWHPQAGTQIKRFFPDQKRK